MTKQQNYRSNHIYIFRWICAVNLCVPIFQSVPGCFQEFYRYLYNRILNSFIPFQRNHCVFVNKYPEGKKQAPQIQYKLVTLLKFCKAIRQFGRNHRKHFKVSNDQTDNFYQKMNNVLLPIAIYFIFVAFILTFGGLKMVSGYFYLFIWCISIRRMCFKKNNNFFLCIL